jgi:hypothetical protein
MKKREYADINATDVRKREAGIVGNLNKYYDPFGK